MWRGTPVIDEIIAQLLSDIAALAKWEAGPGNVLVYAEGDSGFLALSLYKDRGDAVLSYKPSDELTERLFDAWEAAPGDRKWAALLLTIEGSRFETRFRYREEMVAGEEAADREKRAVEAHFGSKPIDYSHWPRF